jgi:hypothetical protein
MKTTHALYSPLTLQNLSELDPCPYPKPHITPECIEYHWGDESWTAGFARHSDDDDYSALRKDAAKLMVDLVLFSPNEIVTQSITYCRGSTFKFGEYTSSHSTKTVYLRWVGPKLTACTQPVIAYRTYIKGQDPSTAQWYHGADGEHNKDFILKYLLQPRAHYSFEDGLYYPRDAQGYPEVSKAIPIIHEFFWIDAEFLKNYIFS